MLMGITQVRILSLYLPLTTFSAFFVAHSRAISEDELR